MDRVEAGKAVRFGSLTPITETIDAMKAARRGALTAAGASSAALLASLNTDG